MRPGLDGITLATRDGAGARDMAGELADVNDVVFAINGSEFDSRPRFLERLNDYTEGHGFTLVEARTEAGQLAGVLFGYVLTSGHWWAAVEPELEPGFTAEDGDRTFAINEIMVRPEFRGRGLATAMHSRVRASHPDKRFTLLVEQENATASGMYGRWGYRSVGAQQPFPDAPLFDSLVLPAARPAASPAVPPLTRVATSSTTLRHL